MTPVSNNKQSQISLEDRTDKGLKVGRLFTKEGKNPFESFEYEKRTSKISNPDGSVVFEMKDVEVPATWSQVATDILAQKYCRKKGVPQLDEDGNEIKEYLEVLGGEI
jgi:ribonucleoside-diphosphate reductase alpha chain